MQIKPRTVYVRDINRYDEANTGWIISAKEDPGLCGITPTLPGVADLILWLLGLQGITVGSVTVWAVMFTVVICSFGIINNQKLLDITLQKKQEAIYSQVTIFIQKYIVSLIFMCCDWQLLVLLNKPG